MSTLISLAVDDVEFNFRKISEQELGIEVEFLKVRRETCREFDINADEKDPEYIALLEELRRILEQHNIEEMTASQMQAQQHDFDTPPSTSRPKSSPTKCAPSNPTCNTSSTKVINSNATSYTNWRL